MARDTTTARKAALARRREAVPCKVCSRPTLAEAGICDRHPKSALPEPKDPSWSEWFEGTGSPGKPCRWCGREGDCRCSE